MVVNIVLALAVGLAAGFYSGLFGVGGASLMTPFLRIVLQVPGHMALGTPLPLVIPTALVGSFVYFRKHMVKIKTTVVCGLSGSIFSVLGALYTISVSSETLMLLTALLLCISAAALYFNNVSVKGSASSLQLQDKAFRAFFIGAVSGSLSGFLGVGGGFILVPLLVVFLHAPLHKAIGSSLAIISIYAVPGSITHFMMGHVDVSLMFLLLIGQTVGAYLGAKYSLKMGENALRRLLIWFLILLGLSLAAFELWGIYTV